MATQMIIAFIVCVGNVFGGWISEFKSIGRKYTIIASFVLTMICLITLACALKSFEYMFGIGMFIFAIGGNVLTTYQCEAYPTKVRDIFNGFFYFVFRFGCIASQFIFYSLYMSDGMFAPYLLLAICSVCLFILSVFIPYDTVGAHLDSNQKKVV